MGREELAWGWVTSGTVLVPGPWEVVSWVFTLYNSLSSTAMDYSLFGICVMFHNEKGFKNPNKSC